MGGGIPRWVHDAISPARFEPYLRATAGDVEAAIVRYEWNSVAAAAFVHPLHYVEVALRNRMHWRLCEHLGSETWWTGARLKPVSERMIQEAKASLRPRGMRAETPDDVVAKLGLGFWVALLSTTYHDQLWVPALHTLFRGADRRSVHREYEAVRRFRNRVMHHEPIHHRHLAADHATLCRLLGELSPEALTQMSRGDRVQEILRARGLP